MKIKSSICINRTINQVWSRFVDTNGWKTWYDGEIISIKPAWQKSAILEWKLGMPSKIIEFDFLKNISIKGDNGMITNYCLSEKDNNSTDFSIENDYSVSNISVSNRDQVENQIKGDLSKFKSYVEKVENIIDAVNDKSPNDKPSQNNTNSSPTIMQQSNNINKQLNTNESEKQLGWAAFYLVIFIIVLVLVFSGPIKPHYIAGLLLMGFMLIKSIISYFKVRNSENDLGVAISKGNNIKIDKDKLLLIMLDPSIDVLERQWTIIGCDGFLAKRLYFDGESVTLKKNDGIIASFSLSQFSPEDKAYLSSIGINRIPNMVGTWKNSEGIVAKYSIEGICKLDNDTYYYTIINNDLVLFTKDSILYFKINVENNKMTTLHESIKKAIKWEKISTFDETQLKAYHATKSNSGNLITSETPEKTNYKNINLENQFNSDKIQNSNNETIISPIDDETKEAIRKMFMEEAYAFMREKYNMSLKEAKKIVTQLKAENKH